MNHKLISDTTNNFELFSKIMHQLSIGVLPPRNARLLVTIIAADENPYLRMSSFSNSFNLRHLLGETWVRNLLESHQQTETEPCVLEQLKNLIEILRSFDPK